MKSLFFLCVASMLTFCCTKNKKKFESEKAFLTVDDYQFSEPQYALVEFDSDTVVSGDIVKGKMYMSSRQLFDISKMNNVDNYLKIKFENNYTPWGPFTRAGTVKGDTAYFEFRAELDSINEEEVTKRILGSILQIKLYPSTKELDTAFALTKDYFIIH